MSALAATDVTHAPLTTGVAQLEVNTLPTPRSLEVPFVQVFEPMKSYTLSLRHGKIATLMTLFESVKLVSLTFSVEITGQSGKLQFAATTSGSAPVNDTAWLASTVYQRFSGNAHGDTYAEYQLPARHPFGHELKAVALGNDPPKFYFRFTGSTGDSARLRGCLVLSGGGAGIIEAINLNELIPPK